MNSPKTVEIAKDIYWVGATSQDGGLHCNPYLLVDGEEAVLIDPGSVLDFADVWENVCSIVPLEKIKYVILHHQDPDFCASVPLFEGKGAKFTIVTHWRTQTLVKYYGIKSDYYIVNNHEFKLTLKSGRVLNFVPTPYLHFPGSLATYDQTSKVLFSSDLFGSFSYEWNLFASDDYLEKMKAFHEHYMPSNDILRPVMEVLLGMDISLIAPQHGSIIQEDVPKYIKALRDLECGSFLNLIKRDIVKSGGYRYVCSLVLKRLASIFSKKEVLEAIGDMDVTLDENLEITDYNYTSKVLWNLLFERILSRKGLTWLLVIDPFVLTLVQEYDLLLPQVFEANLKKIEERAITLNKENEQLKEINLGLEKGLQEVEDKLLRSGITGLYNYKFFKIYLTTEIRGLLAEDSELNPGLILISIDNLERLGYSYGDSVVEEILKGITYILESLRVGYEPFFRLEGSMFACYLPHTHQEEATAYAEKIRNSILASPKFIEKITVSIGVICFDEIRAEKAYINEPEEVMYNTAIRRVKMAKDRGMNLVCSSSLLEEYQDNNGKILVVDTDRVNIDVLKTFLENVNYQVITAGDGEEALRAAREDPLDLIISEIMIPKIDGFLVREKLLAESSTKNIPFIIVSYLKDESTVRRAAELGIGHYFKKPYMLSELIGVIKNIFKGDSYQ